MADLIATCNHVYLAFASPTRVFPTIRSAPKPDSRIRRARSAARRASRLSPNPPVERWAMTRTAPGPGPDSSQHTTRLRLLRASWPSQAPPRRRAAVTHTRRIVSFFCVVSPRVAAGGPGNIYLTPPSRVGVASRIGGDSSGAAARRQHWWSINQSSVLWPP